MDELLYNKVAKCMWPAQSNLKPAELVRFKTDLPALIEHSKLGGFIL